MILTLATGAFAQDSTGLSRSHKQAKESLHLSDKQTTDLKDINRSFISSAKDIRDNQSLSKEEKRTKLEALQNEREEKIKGALSAEQFSQWQQNKDMMKEKMAGRKKWNKEGKGEKFGQKVKEELGLTDEQHQQFKTLNEDFHTQVGSIRHNNELTAEQKQEQIGKLKDEHNGKVQQLLNPEQYEKYQQWVSKRQQRMKSMQRMEDRQLPGKAAPGKS